MARFACVETIFARKLKTIAPPVYFGPCILKAWTSCQISKIRKTRNRNRDANLLNIFLGFPTSHDKCAGLTLELVDGMSSYFSDGMVTWQCSESSAGWFGFSHSIDVAKREKGNKALSLVEQLYLARVEVRALILVRAQCFKQTCVL